MDVDVGWNILCAQHASGAWQCTGKEGDSVPPNSEYLSVAANFDNACGVRASDGGVECWPEESPVPVGAFARVIGTTVSDFCAIDGLGAVSCADELGPWAPDFREPLTAADTYGGMLIGLSSSGAALSSTTSSGNDPETETVSDGRPVQFVSHNSRFPFWLYQDGSMHTGFLDYEPQGAVVADAGWDYACMVDAEHVLTCFAGEDREGDLPPEGKFDTVRLFRDNACAIRTNGKLVCWGDFGDWDTLEDYAEVWRP